MQKSELAKQLRECLSYRQRKKRRDELQAMTDDKIVESLILCPHCGEHTVIDEIELIQAINNAKDASHFIALVTMIEKLHEPQFQN